MRSLYDVHDGGPERDRKTVEQFASQWHAADWKRAEEHWSSLVGEVLRAKDMELFPPAQALRRAEAVILDLLAVALPQSRSRCPVCARCR
ncbi:DUF6313 family protein [Streptomyces sp. CA-250714]|uniref:DUF6313 family protein n=1 Tax=Streptomyces sp. CA-250714 TaxID=3240060 RepID=UPI003D8BF37A